MGSVLLVQGACSGNDDSTIALPDASAAISRGDEPPTPINGNSPVEYPAALYDQRIGGTVILRLFITADGLVDPDSVAIQESSGFPALDSAAIAAAPGLRYSPALRGGVAVATTFQQPITFTPAPLGGPLP